MWLPPIEPCFPFLPSLVYMNGHFLLGQGSINTSEIPFVLINPEASTQTCWLQLATLTLGAFPLGFDWTLALFSLCTLHRDKRPPFPFKHPENILGNGACELGGTSSHAWKARDPSLSFIKSEAGNGRGRQSNNCLLGKLAAGQTSAV